MYLLNVFIASIHRGISACCIMKTTLGTLVYRSQRLVQFKKLVLSVLHLDNWGIQTEEKYYRDLFYIYKLHAEALFSKYSRR